MKVPLLFLCLVVGTMAFPSFKLGLASSEWKAFKELHKKAYRSISEELLRLKIYLKNKIAILAHNIKYKLGRSLYEVEMNKFGDLLANEFKNMSTGFNTTLNIPEPIISGNDTESGETEPLTGETEPLTGETEPLTGETEPLTGETEPLTGETEPLTGETRAFRFTYQPKIYKKTGKRLPAAVDCRRRGQVNVPMYQGQCSGCWAFAATGAIEGQIARKTGKLLRLSQQQLIDCSRENNGCNGGQPNKGFDYVMKNGLVLESTFPYFQKEIKCRFSRAKIVAKIKGYVNIEEDDEDALRDALAFVGPVAVGMDSSNPMFPFYKRGVFAPTFETCSYRAIDHAVLAIGYGREGGKDYWLIKNSWGTKWGEGGYLKLLRNGENLCGIVSKASFPLVD